MAGSGGFKCNTPGCCAPDCFDCMGDYYTDTFDTLDPDWSVSRGNFSINTTGNPGRLQLVRDSTGTGADTNVERTFSSGDPTKIVVKGTVFDVSTDTQILGIGWDRGVGSADFLYRLSVNFRTDRWVLRHNGTNVTGAPNSATGTQHELRMELTEVGSVVNSRFCLDGQIIGASTGYNDTDSLDNNKDIGFYGLANGSNTSVPIGEYDNFCSDIEYTLDGEVAQTATVPTQSATGQVKLMGDVSQTWLMSTQAAAGEVKISGSISQTAPVETQTGSGSLCAAFDCEWECSPDDNWTLVADNCQTGCECDTTPTDPCTQGVTPNQTKPCIVSVSTGST